MFVCSAHEKSKIVFDMLLAILGKIFTGRPIVIYRIEKEDSNSPSQQREPLAVQHSFSESSTGPRDTRPSLADPYMRPGGASTLG